MATIIGLPKLSPTMEEGVLAKWHKKEGDKIVPGDLIAEVETDKANMDFPLEDEGTLLKLLVREGDTVKLGAPVAILGESGEDIRDLLEQAQAGASDGADGVRGAEAAAEAPLQPSPPPAAAKPVPTPTQKSGPPAAAKSVPTPIQKSVPPAAAKSVPTPTAAKSVPAATVVQARPVTPGVTLLASPMAKSLAAENGIDLRAVQGSGPGGRIVERDVRALVDAAPVPAPTAESPPPPAERSTAEPPSEDFTDRSLSLMRKTIARRLIEAKTTIPHFYLTSDCDAAPLTAFRAALLKAAGEDEKITLNDLVVKAAALALRRVPAANAAFLGDRIRTHGAVHIGVAVSVEDGLITPVVRDADRKGIRAIAAEIRDLATRARSRKLSPEEMTGSTFTVSNLGMFGIDHFQAIINPPEAAILAVGAVRKQPVVVDDRLAVGARMALSLSCDHRVVDGVLGAKLLQALVTILENPAALAL